MLLKIVSLSYVNEYIICCYKRIQILIFVHHKTMVVFFFFCRRELLSNSEVEWHDVWQRNVDMPIISDEVLVLQ